MTEQLLTFGERLKSARKAAKMSQAALAARSGISQPTISGIENGEQQGTTAAPQLAAALRVGALWLSDGRGPRHPSAHQAQDQPQGIIAWEHPDDLPADQYALVARRQVKLAAGSGTIVFEDEPLPPLAFRASFLREKHVTSRDNLVTLYADGFSMAPYINDGDAILIDRGQTQVIDNEIYAIDYGGELRLKRLQKRYDGGVLIKSDSPDQARYPIESLSGDEANHIKILGRFIWRGGG